jgi:hypothetical protein
LQKIKPLVEFNAIKILKKAEIIKLKQVDHIINEVKILTFIEHPFLVIKIFFFKFYFSQNKVKQQY